MMCTFLVSHFTVGPTSISRSVLATLEVHPKLAGVKSWPGMHVMFLLVHEMLGASSWVQAPAYEREREHRTPRAVVMYAGNKSTADRSS